MFPSKIKSNLVQWDIILDDFVLVKLDFSKS